jgi:hypothetical protein
MTIRSSNLDTMMQTVEAMLALHDDGGERLIRNILKDPKLTREVGDGVLTYGIEFVCAANIYYETEQAALFWTD